MILFHHFQLRWVVYPLVVVVGLYQTLHERWVICSVAKISIQNLKKNQLKLG